MKRIPAITLSDGARYFAASIPPREGAPFATAPRRTTLYGLRESRSGRIWCTTMTSLFEWDGRARFRHRDCLATRGKIAASWKTREAICGSARTSGIYVLAENGVDASVHRERRFAGRLGERCCCGLQGQDVGGAARRAGADHVAGRVTGAWRRSIPDKSGLAGSEALHWRKRRTEPCGSGTTGESAGWDWAAANRRFSRI